MDHKFIPTFLSVVFVMFVLYALVFMSPIEKIDSACAPLTVWPGKFVEGGLRLGNPTNADKFARSVDSGFNGCRKWLWNAFYDEKYKELKRQANAAAPTSAGTTVTAPAKPEKTKPAAKQPSDLPKGTSDE